MVNREVVLGWVYLFVGATAMGTYPAPMKAPSVLRANVHPVVFQCYKTFWVLVTSWLILLIPAHIQTGGPTCGEEHYVQPPNTLTPHPPVEPSPFPYPFVFSIWGIISAAAWVPSGILNIFQVPIIGLGVSQGLTATSNSFLSFFVGHFALHEEVISLWWSIFWLMMVVIGVCGLATTPHLPTARVKKLVGRFVPHFATTGTAEEREPLVAIAAHVQSEPPPKKKYSMTIRVCAYAAGTFSGFCAALQYLSKSIGVKVVQHQHGTQYMCRRFGPAFLPSFAIGSVIFSVFYLFCVFVYHLGKEIVDTCSVKTSSGDEAVLGDWREDRGGVWGAIKRSVPPAHFRVMAVPGTIAGINWCIGNYFALATFSTPLSNDIGMPAFVSWIFIVSGLWGMFYYREFDRFRAGMWFFFAFWCLASVFMLGRQIKDVHYHTPVDWTMTRPVTPV